MSVHARLPVAKPAITRVPESEARDVFHSFATAMCPVCRKLVDGQRILRDGKVILRKHCAAHGRSEALLSSDADFFMKSLTYVKPGQVPLKHSTLFRRGCPEDCGLCPDHEQHSCLPIIEITNHCNLDCPICLGHNDNSFMMSRAEFAAIIDGLVEKEGFLDTINLSGGEPTLHPELLALLDLARRPEIGRVSISTNGVRIASDRAFCDELARRGVYVSLQLDGFDGDALATLRGRPGMVETKQRALANLEAAGIRTTIVCTVTRGVNELSIGECVKLLLERDAVVSLMIQPAAYTGSGGASFHPHDPLDVVTIPEVIRACEEQSGGLLRATDFLPLPCSHPSCFALTYLLKTDDGYVPFPRFIDVDRYLEIIANRGAIRPDDTFEDSIRETIDEIWAGSDQTPDNAKILRALKNAIRLMYPRERATEIAERMRIGEGFAKTIFIHAFMDEHTFDLARVRRCCTHYALPDGRLMPACAYNMFYRRPAVTTVTR